MPTRDDVQKLVGLMKKASDTEYVFSKIESPDWIPLLVEVGLFSSPYEPIREGNGVGFPAWPQSRFLARLALKGQPEHVQKIMLKTALEMPETQNVRIHEDLTEVALSLDPALSAQFVSHATQWIQSPYHLLLAQKLGALVSHLARGGQVESALRLATSVLEVKEDPRDADSKDDESPFNNILEPRARFDLWDYEQILNKNIPDLVEAAPDLALTLLCDLLDRAIVLSDRRGESRRPEDVSYIWRPAIEDHQQNLNLGLKHLLVAAVRNAGEQIAKKTPHSVPALVQGLKKRGDSWQVFSRIALHLLRLFPDSAPDLVSSTLLDRNLFDSVGVRHEYFLLQRDCFGQLPEVDQKTILDWIGQGPTNLDRVKEAWEQFTGNAWTKDREEGYIRRWKRDHLTRFKDNLDEEWAKQYVRLVADMGEPEHPEFVSYTEGGTWGPHSPKGPRELREMTPREAVAYLLQWQPSADPLRGASREGLGRQLTSVVEEQPEPYASDAADFKRLPEPTYVRAIIQGFESALRHHRNFTWPPVLRLCQWAAAHERSIPGREVEHFEMDPHWGWTRAAVARLVTAGFKSKDNPIPHELRGLAWLAIVPSTDDPEPAPEKEQRSAGDHGEKYRKWGMKVRSSDPLTKAINSTRGVAMQAVVEYALWVRKGFENSESKDASPAKGFEAMPEVRNVLDAHLDTNVESSLSIRAVYGERLPWLQLLDRKWVTENVGLILPRNQLGFWHAAWDTYVCYSAPYDDVFDLLKGEYAFATEQIGNHQHEWEVSEAPDFSLGRHLITMYWRGKFDQERELFDAFYRQADEKLCAYVLHYVGVSLRDTKGPTPDDIAQRLKRLWTGRVEAAKQQAGSPGGELKEFGWWFVSGKFDDNWSIDQLLKALRLARSVEPDHLVVERLAEMSRAMPLECVKALAMMVEGDTKGWGVLGWRDKAKEILRAARKSGNPEARAKAEDLIDLFGSRGQFDFGELLREPV